MTESTFIDRMVTEKTELDEKISKAQAFLSDEKYQDLTPENRSLFNAQLIAMEQYAFNLGERIRINSEA